MLERVPMHDIELTGLDGSNLLAFLAALGALRALSMEGPATSVRMSWTDNGRWTPVLHHTQANGEDEVLTLLEQCVCGEDSIRSPWRIGNDLTLSCTEFAVLMREAAMGASTKREEADYLAAFGSDVYGAGPKKELISDTAFRTMSGAGHQHFLSFMRELAAGTEREHLRRALFAPWDYADSRPSLRWDPADYRPHALRAVDPSGDPIRTMRGANRLAIEALPFFPTVPQQRRIRTVAFEEGDDGTAVVWPIWTERLDVTTVASLLAWGHTPGITEGKATRPGIAQVFRARRFTEGKYRNFTPAKALL
jgi:hypothetical protein